MHEPELHRRRHYANLFTVKELEKKRKGPLVPRFSSYANLPINMLLGTKALWKSERDTSVHKRKGCSLTYFIFSSLFICPDLCASQKKKVITKNCEIVLLDWTSADGVE